MDGEIAFSPVSKKAYLSGKFTQPSFILVIDNLQIYDEIAVFMANRDPAKVLAFKPSSTSQERLDHLLDKQKETGLSIGEISELEHYLIINRIVGLAKARALRIMSE